MRYFIELSYNGKAYHGWQIQPNAITVQEVLQKALSTLLRTPIEIIGAGRTDTGVHASQMFAHFDYNKSIDEVVLPFKLNSYLPKDIAIHSIFKVKNTAHTRFDALSRTYIYKVSTCKNVFSYANSYYLNHDIDLERMNAAAKILFEYTNFQCFSKSNTDVKTYICEIMEAHWKKVDNEIIFTITANRFLRNMVRAIVGTLLAIGKGTNTIEDLHRIIKSRNRCEAGTSVPGYALYLCKIEYPKTITNHND